MSGISGVITMNQRVLWHSELDEKAIYNDFCFIAYAKRGMELDCTCENETKHFEVSHLVIEGFFFD